MSAVRKMTALEMQVSPSAAMKRSGTIQKNQVLIQTTISITTYSGSEIVQFREKNFKQFLMPAQGFIRHFTSGACFPSATAPGEGAASVKIARNFQELLLFLFDDSEQSLYV